VNTKFRLCSLAVVFNFLILFFKVSSFALPYSINMDTSALSGTSAQLAFDFVDGGPPSNTITITNFVTDGTLGNATLTGDVVGSLSGTVTLSDAFFFNEYLTDLTLGNSFSFLVDFTSNPPASGSSPDAFSFFLLNPLTGLPINTTSDPTGAGSLLTLNLDGTSQPSLNGYDTSVTAVIYQSSSVPEPNSLLLLGSGVLFLLLWRYRGKTTTEI
jgi:hypothetical protein